MTEETPSWDKMFIETARLWSKKSKDPSTKIGACIAGPDNELISTGYNNLPRDVVDNLPQRNERPEKYFWYEHGERNAIYQAARQSGIPKGSRMYLSCGMPCSDCARAIIQVGIKEVILGLPGCASSHPGVTKTKWEEEGKRSEIMFKEAKVKVRVYEEEE